MRLREGELASSRDEIPNWLSSAKWSPRNHIHTNNKYGLCRFYLYIYLCVHTHTHRETETARQRERNREEDRETHMDIKIFEEEKATNLRGAWQVLEEGAGGRKGK